MKILDSSKLKPTYIVEVVSIIEIRTTYTINADSELEAEKLGEDLFEDEIEIDVPSGRYTDYTIEKVELIAIPLVGEEW